MNVFQTAYTASGLPANGPTITRPLVRMMNALSDGTMIFVIFLMSIIMLLISMLCIHFILSLQMERDRKEVGMLKALGIGRKEIRRLYFAKISFVLPLWRVHWAGNGGYPSKAACQASFRSYTERQIKEA